jgi:hypothetical protein
MRESCSQVSDQSPTFIMNHSDKLPWLINPLASAAHPGTFNDESQQRQAAMTYQPTGFSSTSRHLQWWITAATSCHDYTLTSSVPDGVGFWQISKIIISTKSEQKTFRKSTCKVVSVAISGSNGKTWSWCWLAAQRDTANWQTQYLSLGFKLQHWMPIARKSETRALYQHFEEFAKFQTHSFLIL